jgi:hypothetical protein
MAGNRDSVIATVVGWYAARSSQRPYYRICFGEVAADRSRIISARAWGDGKEALPTDQFGQWLREDLRIAPAGTYVIQIRRNGSDNRSAEELPFELPNNDGTPAPAVSIGVPPGYISIEDVDKRIAAATKMQSLEMRLEQLERENKELRKNGGDGSDGAIAGAIGEFMKSFNYAIQMKNGQAPQIGNPEKKTIDVTQHSQQHTAMPESLENALTNELTRLSAHLGGDAAMVEKLSQLNDKLDDPSAKAFILSAL